MYCNNRYVGMILHQTPADGIDHQPAFRLLHLLSEPAIIPLLHLLDGGVDGGKLSLERFDNRPPTITPPVKHFVEECLFEFIPTSRRHLYARRCHQMFVQLTRFAKRYVPLNVSNYSRNWWVISAGI